MDEIVRLRLANPGGGPHSVTGPIMVSPDFTVSLGFSFGSSHPHWVVSLVAGKE